MSSLKDNLEEKKDALIQGIESTKKEFQEDLAETKQSISQGIETGKRAVSKFVRRLMWVLLIAGILAGVGYIVFASINYSVGSRAGELIKISQKGIVFKTHEGQLSLGGIGTGNSNTNTSLGNLWDFSVTDHEVIKKLEVLQGKKVILTYKEKYRLLPWRGDTKYIITEVQEN